MAKCIAYCEGIDQDRVKQDSRLGSVAARGRACTWRTFATADVNADGSGYVTVVRDDKTIHRFEFGPEGSNG